MDEQAKELEQAVATLWRTCIFPVATGGQRYVPTGRRQVTVAQDQKSLIERFCLVY